MQTSHELLAKLVGFPTVSRDSNLELIDYIKTHLSALGAECHILPNAEGTKANLFATLGPQGDGGVVLSGHTDVVPIDGQKWDTPPFTLTERDQRFYGRGTADMKGFIACALRIATQAAERELQSPLHFAFSYDEEVGCLGVRPMLDFVSETGLRPALCIVGEPTSLEVGLGHKGKTDFRVVCTGREAHSSFAPGKVSALHLACDFVAAIRAIQDEINAKGAYDEEYDVPRTTLHVGVFHAGTALNIVPGKAEMEMEFRNLHSDSSEDLIQRVQEEAAKITAETQKQDSETGIEVTVEVTNPALDTPADSFATEFVKSLTGGNSTCKVAYGTEAGLFAERLNLPTVLCGPGSITQAHQPNEWVALDQLARCDAMLENLLVRLEAGI